MALEVLLVGKDFVPHEALYGRCFINFDLASALTREHKCDFDRFLVIEASQFSHTRWPCDMCESFANDVLWSGHNFEVDHDVLDGPLE